MKFVGINLLNDFGTKLFRFIDNRFVAANLKYDKSISSLRDDMNDSIQLDTELVFVRHNNQDHAILKVSKTKDVKSGDVIRFARNKRYGSSIYIDNVKKRIKKRGWCIPKIPHNGSPMDSINVTFSPLSNQLLTELFTRQDISSYSFYKLSFNGEEFTNKDAWKNYIGCHVKDGQPDQYYLSDTLGIKVYRNGKSITEWLPFKLVKDIDGNFFYSKMCGNNYKIVKNKIIVNDKIKPETGSSGLDVGQCLNG